MVISSIPVWSLLALRRCRAILDYYIWINFSWWRHQMETFFPLLAFWAGNSPVTGEFHAQRRVTRGFDVFFDLRLNKRLSKQSWGWWFETPLHSLWRHFNGPWTRAQLLFRTVYHLTCNCFVLHTTCCNHAKPFIFLTEHITLVGPFINTAQCECEKIWPYPYFMQNYVLFL